VIRTLLLLDMAGKFDEGSFESFVVSFLAGELDAKVCWKRMERDGRFVEYMYGSLYLWNSHHCTCKNQVRLQEHLQLETNAL
jgi:hypothetical protein